jgi:ribosomal protein S18 acetylase RimI-like enzyme
MKRLLVRNTRQEDIPELIRLQRRVYPDIPSWSRRDLGHQLEVFPQGQLVIEHDGKLAGCASSLIVLWNDWSGEHTWQDVTAAGTFDSHNPEGRTLYGAEVFVDPEIRGAGLGQALYEGRRAICRQCNLKRIIACGRMPGYGRHADQMSPELYAKKVVWGDLRDPVLGFQLHQGFSYCGVIENYLPEDNESRGHASLIVWLNPDYDADLPTRFPEEIRL